MYLYGLFAYSNLLTCICQYCFAYSNVLTCISTYLADDASHARMDAMGEALLEILQGVFQYTVKLSKQSQRPGTSGAQRRCTPSFAVRTNFSA